MLKFELLLLGCIFSCYCYVHSSSSNKITEELENGCKITRYKSNETKAYVAWYAMPLPHLNCSGSGQTRLNADGVVKETKSITLSYNDLFELHIDDLKKFTMLQKLEVKSNKLQRIVPPSDSNLVLQSVTHVSLTNNLLTEIPTTALKSFPNLKVLVLSLNKITTIFDDDFRFSPNLSYIVLGPNPITTFNSGWMKKLKMTGLNLRGCGLTEFPNSFQNQSSLVYADLSDNKITTLPANSFPGCKNLRWFELASNQLKTIHQDAFKGAYQLSSLDLSDNLLETIKPGTLESISKENLRVDLYENPFNCNCSMAAFKSWYDEMKMNDQSTEVRFKCYQPARNHGKKSHQVTLDDFTCDASDVMWKGECDATTSAATQKPVFRPILPPKTCPIGCTCFDESKNIYYPPPGQNKNNQASASYYIRFLYPRVDCVDTNYSMIPPAIPVNVSMITLSGNRISIFRLSQLKRYGDVKTLQLKGNNIKTIIQDYNTVLKKVRILNLSFNKIALVKKDYFKSFPNVEVIALHHNSITSVPEDLFAFNRKLQRLYFGPNPIHDFKEDFMKTLNLKSLSLRNMSLKAVPKSLRNLNNVSYIDLSDNLITNITNATFSKCLSLGRLVMDNNRISKIEADAFNGALALFSIDLSENQLTTLPANVFSNVSHDRLTVELWQNPFLCDCKMKRIKEWIEKSENEDPATEIRFVCAQPMRMHDKKSDQLSAEDFYCAAHDTMFVPHESICHAQSYAGQIAFAVFLTFAFTMLLCLIAWKCTFKRRYGTLLQYTKQRDDMADMEELQ